MSAPLTFQMHSLQHSKNFMIVVNLLKKANEEQELEIQVTEVPYKELSEAQADTKRLEWLIAPGRSIEFEFASGFFVVENFIGKNTQQKERFSSPREAIDSAMKDQQ